MTLRCIKPFGDLKPGDKVDVPDDAGFDPFYFERAVKSASNARERK